MKTSLVFVGFIYMAGVFLFIPAAGNGLLPEGFGKNLSELKDQGLEKIEAEAKDKLNDLGESLLKGDK